MKGIILAGGSGSRLLPLTKVVCKQLLPVYDKPMIYYPLYTLMLANIKDILIISTEKDIPKFIELFSDGSHLGLNLEYAVQPEPKGIAEAFIIGEKFIGDSSVALILGDNLFFGNSLSNTLKSIPQTIKGATIFGYEVHNPTAFGVAEIDRTGAVLSIEEKPLNPKSNLAIPGLYLYDNEVVSIAKALTPSYRNELEITDVNKEYLKRKKLHLQVLDNDVVWYDTGTHENLLEASLFIKSVRLKHNINIGDVESFNKK